MGEVKSVKVDNWGVFFLQKLQNFFNKTDYCDLTLQFRDNSQLKVHRLVLSACTDYFNVLEQSCEIIDDALIMPNEFQADVIVPIVNFMYTGTLEFELKMYGKLLRTAKEMNMTVLLKLLEAHRRTMENVNRQQRPPSPKGIRRRPVGPVVNAGATTQRVMVPSNQNRSSQVISTGGVTTMRRTVESNTQRVVGATSIRATAGINNRTQYITTSPEVTIKQEQQSASSPFEQLRKGYNNTKRPAQTSLASPAAKKPNLEDVKEFAEQQRMRKQIAAEYGDQDQDYEGMLFDDVHTGDDDDDDMPPQPSTSKQQVQQQQQQQQNQAQSGNQTQMEHGTTTIILKQDSPNQTPTIIVKDSSNAKLNHTKIIAEVLRQYPHIVKGHKNIKLKILPNTPVQSPEKTTAAVAAATIKQESPTPSQQTPTPPLHKKLHVSFKPDKSSPMITAAQKAPLRESTTQQKLAASEPALLQTTTTASQSIATAVAPQKRRIDSKTMHALIALGAENTTGPWLCLRCGVNGRPISIPSYRGFRRHLINSHKETIDPALCEHCGWRSSNNRDLHFHMYTEHQIKSPLYTFSECTLCNQWFVTKSELEQHINAEHTENNKQPCIYCNKVFNQEMQLYRHMKTYHQAQALEDGIIDETDEEYLVSQDEDEEPVQEAVHHTEEKVRILSDISLPATSPVVAQKQHNEPEEEQEVKFVGADGHEVELTAEQRKEILSQLNQQQAGAASGGVVMVLNEGETEIKQDVDAKSAAGTEEEYDDSQIYNELGEAASASASDSNIKNTNSASLADESKESMDNLEWAENLISEQELEAERTTKDEPAKSEGRRDDISEKLKELTGDWTEDENEDDGDGEADVDAEDRQEQTGSAISATGDEAAETVEKLAEESVKDAVDAATAATTSAADVVDDDDIDLALQTLHKEGDDSQPSSDQITADGEIVSESSTSAVNNNSNASTKRPVEDTSVEKLSVDDIIKAATAAVDAQEEESNEDKLHTIKMEEVKDEEQEFIKETPATVEAGVDEATTTENAQTLVEKVEKSVTSHEVTAATTTTTNTEQDSHLETEHIGKELLDELIAEAGKPVADDDLVPETQLLPSAAELALNTAEEEDRAAEEADGQSNTAAAGDSKTITSADDEEPNTSDAAGANNTQSQEATAVSADKIKSLISEWADDDVDDVDDEDGVSAAAKEEL